MGFRTVIVLDNDTFHLVQEHPGEVIGEIARAMNETRRDPTLRVGQRVVGRVVECRQKSEVSVLLVYGSRGEVFADLGVDAPVSDDERIVGEIVRSRGFRATLRLTPQRTGKRGIKQRP